MRIYVVHFDDSTFLGNVASRTTPPRYVREYPDAHKFTSRRAAEQASSWANKPATVEQNDV